jgi:phosphatidylserine/phosphatidylglycerophosphate/cardiolipin synthase-like enzyme
MTTPAPLSVLFLRDTRHGGPAGQLATVAGALAAFVAAATTSVDVAIYDFRLDDADAVSTVVGALTGAAARGVTVRIGFDAGKPETATAETFALLQADPAPPGTADWVRAHFDGTPVQVRPIAAGGQLMHDKYIVRDGTAVWTGSTNFTDDAWTRQENNVVVIEDAQVAAGYAKDFGEMWTAGKISGTGRNDAGTATVGGGSLGWDFCPGDGKAVNAALAARVSAAEERLVVAAMVLTSHEVLDALAKAVGRGVPVSGIYDGGQMDPIVAQWAANPNSAAVLADWRTVEPHLVRKSSTPYSPTSIHDFMHLKVLVSDDVLTTGSYNFSANAERNAENQVHLTDPATVAAYVTYLSEVTAAYA